MLEKCPFVVDILSCHDNLDFREDFIIYLAAGDRDMFTIMLFGKHFNVMMSVTCSYAT